MEVIYKVYIGISRAQGFPKLGEIFRDPHNKDYRSLVKNLGSPLCVETTMCQN